jgi:hypothetical protein
MTDSDQSTDFIQNKITSRVLAETVAEQDKPKEATKDTAGPSVVPAKPVFATRLSDKDMFDCQIRNILIFLPIVLVFVLYYAVMSIIEMPITKSSLLYAKYGSSKTSLNSQ